tara:strand:- start:15 stop:416 length:402 start_codon:yes stop_codon:yes gene_type:complete
MESVQKFAESTVGAYPLIALGALVFLVILALYLIITCSKQGFMPSSTLRYQKLDGLGFEGLAGGVPAGGPNAGPVQGSAAWNILNSDAFACDQRGAPNDDAWAWMNKQSAAVETAVGGRPKTESDFTKLLAGQ